MSKSLILITVECSSINTHDDVSFHKGIASCIHDLAPKRNDLFS